MSLEQLALPYRSNINNSRVSNSNNIPNIFSSSVGSRLNVSNLQKSNIRMEDRINSEKMRLERSRIIDDWKNYDENIYRSSDEVLLKKEWEKMYGILLENRDYPNVVQKVEETAEMMQNNLGYCFQNQEIVSYLSFLIPMVKLSLKKMKDLHTHPMYKINEFYSHVDNNRTSGYAFVYRKSKFANENPSVSIVCSREFNNNNQAFLKDPKETAFVIHAAYASVSKYGFKRIVKFIYSHYIAGSIVLSPCQLVQALAYYYLVNSSILGDFENEIMTTYQEKNPPPLIFGVENHGMGDYFGTWCSSIFIPTNKADNQQIISYIKEQLGAETDLFEVSRDLKELKEISTQIEKMQVTLQLDQEKTLNEITTAEEYQIQLYQSMQEDKSLLKEVANYSQVQLSKVREVEQESLKIESKLKRFEENLQNVEINIPMATEQSLQNEVQIKTAINYFAGIYRGYSQFKSVVNTEMLDKLPFDISISILLIERKRRLNFTRLKVKILTFIKELNHWVNDPQLMNEDPTNEINLQMREISSVVEMYTQLPLEEIRILIEKGKRIQILMENSRNTQIDVTYIRSSVEKMIGNSSVVPNLIDEHFKMSTESLERIKNNIEDTKFLLANFNPKTEFLLSQLFEAMTEKVGQASFTVLSQFSDQLNYFSTTFSIKIDAIGNIVSENSKKLDLILAEIGKIAGEIKMMKIEITEINKKANVIYQNTDRIIDMLYRIGTMIPINGTNGGVNVNVNSNNTSELAGKVGQLDIDAILEKISGQKKKLETESNFDSIVDKITKEKKKLKELTLEDISETLNNKKKEIINNLSLSDLNEQVKRERQIFETKNENLENELLKKEQLFREYTNKHNEAIRESNQTINELGKTIQEHKRSIEELLKTRQNADKHIEKIQESWVNRYQEQSRINIQMDSMIKDTQANIEKESQMSNEIDQIVQKILQLKEINTSDIGQIIKSVPELVQKVNELVMTHRQSIPSGENQSIKNELNEIKESITKLKNSTNDDKMLKKIEAKEKENDSLIKAIEQMYVILISFTTQDNKFFDNFMKQMYEENIIKKPYLEQIKKQVKQVREKKINLIKVKLLGEKELIPAKRNLETILEDTEVKENLEWKPFRWWNKSETTLYS